MGEAGAGQRRAVISSVVQSCRTRVIDRYAYLRDHDAWPLLAVLLLFAFALAIPAFAAFQRQKTTQNMHFDVLIAKIETAVFLASAVFLPHLAKAILNSRNKVLLIVPFPLSYSHTW
jgi:hypothetical protein